MIPNDAGDDLDSKQEGSSSDPKQLQSEENCTCLF